MDKLRLFVQVLGNTFVHPLQLRIHFLDSSAITKMLRLASADINTPTSHLGKI